MKDDFLAISSHDQFANYIGLTYKRLSKVIYSTGDDYKYHIFYIPKKNGGTREIASPCKKLKEIQSKLKDVLYEIYTAKASTHGFAKGRSIVTNAEKHLDKNFIFNLDISDFFGAIHFGRVRNLFKSYPFSFNHSVATIIAQICCFKNSIPQGAPTSPIISNMIAFKLDSHLQQLAKNTKSTYTRYADDISFSFTCGKNKLPEDIVKIRDGSVSPGSKVVNIIEENGFEINYDKVRLCNRFSRMEVTGLRVNEFINVRRQYIRNISSMIYAWEKHGYNNAGIEYNAMYSRKHRASSKPVSFIHVVKGKLAFLKNVRTGHDLIYNKLAKRFNELIDKDQLDEKHKFNIYEPNDPEQNAINSLWVIETCYGNVAEQGTGFDVKDVGIVTCAHVVSNIVDNRVFDKIKAYKTSDTTKEYNLKVTKICYHRDIAICSIHEKVSETTIELSNDKSRFKKM